MVAFFLSSADGEMLVVGLLAMLGAMIFYKLDQMMKLQEKTNELLAKSVSGGKPDDPKKTA